MKRHLRSAVALGFFVVAGTSVMAGGLQDLPAWQPDANAKRSAIPDVYKWQLDVLVADDEAWEIEAGDAAGRLEALGALRAGLDSPEGLAKYLEAYFAADELINRLTLYANLRRDTDTVNQAVIARHQRALTMTNDLMGEGPALRQAILSLDAEALEKAYAAEPALATFRPFIDQLRRRADHVLGPEGEKVLALAGDNLWAQIDLNELPSPSENAFSSLVSEMDLPEVMDEKGETVQLSFSNYGLLRGSSNREVRRQAVAGMFETLKGYENTFAATLGGQAAFDVFLGRARGYDSALEAYLDKDDIDPAVYRNLIETVRANVPLLHRYITMRKQVMQVEQVHLYDLYVPLAESTSAEITYSEGAVHILEALRPLGKTYIDRLAQGLDPASGWIDVYPSKNKDSGAFSASGYGVRPFVKMNFQNRYDDVSTLAHEFGHALHSDFSMKAQGYQTWRYPPFLAEIASTCNEMLLSHYMVEQAASDAERAWLLSELVETIRTTIFRQAMFADFELQVHELVEEGKPVTAEALNGIYRELVETYYGPDYTIDENDAIEWAYIPHFYFKYYVFTYATGLTSGIAIAERIRSGVPGAQEAYLGMLRGGCSRPPLDMLRDAGVDLSKPDPIEAAMAVFERTLGQLEVLLKDDA
ncbi:MAG: oligoendopeptidase F [Acidobacteria bacterium]|nr:MAG: oligoendopeptidase F [Acidobacteriota bacterium]